MNYEDDSDNPKPVIGKPQPRSSLGELIAWHALNNTLHSFLVEIGWFYYHPGSRDGGRDR